MQQKVYLLYPVLVVKTPSIHTKQQTIDKKFIYLQLTEPFFFVERFRLKNFEPLTNGIIVVIMAKVRVNIRRNEYTRIVLHT